MLNSEKNYWPHFIIGLILFAVTLGIWTIKATMDNPVELDNSYMLNYHAVDEDINEILKKQHIFDKRYDLILSSTKIKLGSNTIELILKDKNGKVIDNADIKILVTRPDTTKYDKKIDAKFENSRYIAHVDLEKEGRWNIVIKTKIGDIEGFKTFKLSTLGNI